MPVFRLYLDLIKASGLGAAIRRHVRAAGGQGWLDIQMVLAVIFLNLAGGDCVEDIERLERDGGFSAILRAIEKDLLSRAERRSLKSRWRRERERATPSPSALSGWLERFHDPDSPKAVAGTAFIPAVTEELRGLWRVNQALLAFLVKGRLVSDRVTAVAKIHWREACAAVALSALIGLSPASKAADADNWIGSWTASRSRPGGLTSRCRSAFPPTCGNRRSARMRD